MAEKIVSPGVFTSEIDQTFLPAAIADIGAVVVGPTVKGPTLVPTVVTSYSEYVALFGDTFTSGSSDVAEDYTYLTSQTAKNYLQHSDKLTVVRILAGNYSGASATISSSIDPAIIGNSAGSDWNNFGNKATGSFVFPQTGSGGDGLHTYTGSGAGATHAASLQELSASIGGVTFVFTGSITTAGSEVTRLNTATKIHVVTGSVTQVGTHVKVAEAFANAINHSGSLHGLTSFLTASFDNSASLVGITSSFYGPHPGQPSVIGGPRNSNSTRNEKDIEFTFGPLTGSAAVNFHNGISDITASAFSGDLGSTQYLDGGSTLPSFKTPFKLHTLADGEIMNNQVVGGTGGMITTSGSRHNIRWEVSNVNYGKGTFDLLIRRGDDIHKRKQILETWNGLTLDPKDNSYIAKRIGDSYLTIGGSGTTDPYLTYVGTYPNKSKYVRVEVIEETVDYLDENGNVRVPAASASLPTFTSGSQSGSLGGGFTGGSDGTVQHPKNFYENITQTNTQGLNPTVAASGQDSYIDALNLLSNQDEYDVNLILLPGIISAEHSAVTTKAIDVCEGRGDCFVIVDPVLHGKNITDVTTESATKNSNYAGMYWPWVQLPDNQTGTNNWVPPSVAVAGMYAFNDKVAQPWFAPAGLNRGGLTTAVQAERKLTISNRDTLYDSNVNPVATFPGQGVVVWGQKTLQKKSSALDRVNVRRLLIKVKKFIASSSRFLVFEQNNSKTRQRFLGIANPFLEQVQSQSGLEAFRVIMDDSNNTPDVVDRNILYGQIFLQPTRTAEFILLDFTIQPTGATFEE